MIYSLTGLVRKSTGRMHVRSKPDVHRLLWITRMYESSIRDSLSPMYSHTPSWCDIQWDSSKVLKNAFSLVVGKITNERFWRLFALFCVLETLITGLYLHNVYCWSIDKGYVFEIRQEYFCILGVGICFIAFLCDGLLSCRNFAVWLNDTKIVLSSFVRFAVLGFV